MSRGKQPFANREDSERTLRRERTGFLDGRKTKVVFTALFMALLFACMGAAAADTTFEGTENPDSSFDPAHVVTLEMAYKYSNTGGLAGVNVAAPQKVKAVATLLGDGGTPEDPSDDTYRVSLALPTTPAGFRVVLDPAELNKYLVKPPTGGESADELAKKLENGDFNVDIDHHTVYYWQEISSADHTVQHPKYQNRYSTVYNEAWNDARWIKDPDPQTGYRAEAVCGNSAAHPSGVENHGANKLVDPRLEVTLTQAQLENARTQGLSITVYYRRNATWYTVNHWVPKNLSGLTDFTDCTMKTKDNVEYVRLNQETLQGRVGATTNAEAKNDGVYTLLSPVGFSQKLIAQQDTEVDIDYKAANAYRVIFDTDYTYIPRQTVELGNAVDFTRITTEPRRTGYTFAGWQYWKLKQGEKPDANGEYSAGQYEYTDVNWNSSNSNYELTIDDGLVKSAKIVNIDGVPALHLYPKWTPDTTTVRVILWTEDLTGTDDVYAKAENGTTNYYDTKYAKYSNSNLPVTHDPKLEESNPNYSNVRSFTVDVDTDLTLVDNTQTTPRLLTEIQNQVDTQFRDAMGDVDGIAVNQFYSPAGFQIVHEKADDEIEYGVTEASADGKTTINVFFTRNIYELRFHYYGTVDGKEAVAYNTNGYSLGGIKDKNNLIDNQGELIFSYKGSGSEWTQKNLWAYVNESLPMPVPETITIRAKYGADLRDVWPVARYDEQVDTDKNSKTRMISWATTQGKYCADGLFGTTSEHNGEATIMGVYAAMGSEIIADPSDTDAVHHLVAYWHWTTTSYYRYNHCYEVPGLEISSDGVRTLHLHGGENNNDLENLLYLVPSGNKAIAGYQDLMPVSYNGVTVTYDDANGGFYAVRGYRKDGGDIKYYAVSKRVRVMSTNAIEKQNPSARLHMKRVNTNPDHTTEYTNDKGNAIGGTQVGKEGAPYDLYFYYDRDCYTITYMAPCNAENSPNTEVTLGTITLPYGAPVTKEKYGFALDYQDKNTDPKYPWELNKLPEVSVCPDRSTVGAKAWTFEGWALGPAGVNMQWRVNQDEDVEAQAGENFYIEGNLRLYAIWDAPTYTVTFHLKGGSVPTDNDPKSTANVVQNIPANTRYSASGAIPRPTRQGYTFLGWYALDGTAFDFDQKITRDWHVNARWEAETEKKFHYRVYYVTDNPLPADQHNETVENNGKRYYVLDKVEHPNVPYVADMVLNLSPVAIEGYVPQSTDALLTPDPALDSTDWDKVVFCYDPITAHRHRVQFVEAGTEKNQPTVIHERQTEVEADVLAVTPSAEDVTELLNKGYGLVNRQNDGSYMFVTAYEQLTWIDENNVVQPYQNLSGEDIPDVITYLVSKIPYTVTYKNAPGSPAAANDELKAITAAENTTPDSANGKNPTLYHKGDAFAVRNPQRVHDATKGKWYQFAYWTLDNGTNVAANSPDKPTQFNPLSVAAGTTGNLTFVANWTDTDVEPKPDVPKTDVTITKIWNDAGYTGRPSAFTIHVTAEDDPTFSYTKVIKRDDVSVVVSPDGNTWTFKASWNVHSYRIEELDVPGYVSSVSGENNRFVITNTYMPKTGDRTHLLRNVLLLCCGVALVAAAGLVIDKKRR